MSRCLPVLSDEEFQSLIDIMDAGVRAAGLQSVIRIAPVLEKLLQATEVVEATVEE